MVEGTPPPSRRTASRGGVRIPLPIRSITRNPTTCQAAEASEITGRIARCHAPYHAALRERIDMARELFHEQFFAPCASMVDYLHLELLRTLANDDPDLFGKDYPGPLV